MVDLDAQALTLQKLSSTGLFLPAAPFFAMHVRDLSDAGLLPPDALFDVILRGIRYINGGVRAPMSTLARKFCGAAW